MQSRYIKRLETSIEIENALGICFCFWPLFQNIWVNLKVAYYFRGIDSAIAILLLITALSCLCNPMFIDRGLPFYIWVLFFSMIFFHIVGGRCLRPDTVRDLIIYLCALYFCVIQSNESNNNAMINVIFYCGLFVTATVLLDFSIKLFRERLINIYVDAAKYYKLTRKITTTGGIFPNTSAAGAFIVTGLVAYVTRLRKQLRNNGLKWLIIISFAIAFLIIQKRSFILASCIAILTILIVHALFCFRRWDGKVDLYRVLVVGLIVCFIFLVCLFSYSKIGFVRNIMDSFLSKFENENDPLSGRTVLYELALKLYSKSPVFGIGWAKYRPITKSIYKTATMDAHNVYLQLLCETGIVGTILYVTAVIVSLTLSILHYRKTIVSDTSECVSAKRENLITIEMGLFFQIFYIIYSLTGNPLYDYYFVIFYFMGLYFALHN